VLGIVAAVRGLAGGRLVASIRPATLDRAYSRLRITLGDTTLGDLEGAEASGSASRLFTCSGSGPAAKFDVDADFSKLKPQFELDISRPEIFFLLSGTAKLDADVSSRASKSCRYTGSARIVIPVPGTPVVITVKPAVSGTLSGDVGVDFSWSPRIAVGLQKGPGVNQDFHAFNKGSVTAPSFHGSAKASLFLGVTLGVSVADRVGLEGKAGPQLEASTKLAPGSACLDADAWMHADIDAFADVFVKRWSFSIAKGDFGNLRLLHACHDRGAGGGGGGAAAGGSNGLSQYSLGGAGDRTSLTWLSQCEDPLSTPGVLSADAQALFVGCPELGVYSLSGNSAAPLEGWPPPGVSAVWTSPSAMSPDARFVVAPISETIMGPGPSLQARVKYYLVDRDTESPERVDVAAPGGSDECIEPGLTPRRLAGVSDDGRYVAFMTCARLVPGDQNNLVEAYLRDRVAGTTTRLPTDCGGDYDAVTVSGDGRYVGYTGCVLNSQTVCNGSHAILFDRATSAPVDASPGCGLLLDASPDGRYALSSGYSSADETYVLTVFDRATGSARLIAATDGYVTNGSLSADGRYVGYFEQLAGGGAGYRLDRVALRKSRLDVNPGDVPSGCPGFDETEVSRDGRTVAFTTCGALLPEDDDGAPSVYVARFP
jgi:Tol biopolymer transport system component